MVTSMNFIRIIKGLRIQSFRNFLKFNSVADSNPVPTLKISGTIGDIILLDQCLNDAYNTS